MTALSIISSISTVFLLGTSGWAGSWPAPLSPLPSEPCAKIKEQECTPVMFDLLHKFKGAQDLVPVSGVYTGGCYYHSERYGPHRKHYGALLIEVDGTGTPHFNGIFSFFGEPDRFDDWSFERARALYRDPYRYPMVSYGTYSMADYNPDGIWRFWLSQNHSSGEIYLISYWGYKTRGFCNFIPVETAADL